MESNSPPTQSSWFALMLPAHIILAWRRVPHCCLPVASHWPFLQCRTQNSTGRAVANLLDPTHPTPKRRARITRCLRNTMKSWAGGLGERGRDYWEQLAGELSAIPADPLPPTAGNGDAQHSPCCINPCVHCWYPLDICSWISSREPYVVNAC